MVERIPIYGDATLRQVHEFETTDTIPGVNLPTNVLLDNAAGVPFTPANGIEASEVQGAVAELAGRHAGGRRQTYFPYIIQREQDRVQRVHRTGQWVAGAVISTAGAGVLHTHGTNGHLSPFMTFSALDNGGHPHMDHDRLNSNAGPDLTTGIGSTLSAAGLARFIHPTAGDWTTGPEAFSSGNWVHVTEFTGAQTGNNGYWLIDSFESSGGTNDHMVVRDPDGLITAIAVGAGPEVRGTTTNTSGFNGYLEGILLHSGTLYESEERVRFRAQGLLKNTVASSNFVEFVLEPNPACYDANGEAIATRYTGANRMRMLSGQLGATWTGNKRFVWECELHVGFANTGDEYQYTWTMDIEDILGTGGYGLITSGADFKAADVVLSPRFRVDEITNLDIYDDTYQGNAGLQLEIQKIDMEPIH